MLDNTKRWLDVSTEDFEMANVSFNHGRYLHMAFFCQQAIEKALKGFYYERHEQTPPRKHDLVALARASGVIDELSLPQQTFLTRTSEFYIESRYPEERLGLAQLCTKEYATEMLAQTKEVLSWLNSKLS